MPVKLEFFYDCSSPWTYLGFTNIQPIAARYGVEVQWRPILVGGVFNAVNQMVYAGREMMFADEKRLKHFLKDLQDWAEYSDLKIGWPKFHPVNSVKAMRGCFVAEEAGCLLAYSQQVFEAYWGREEDISDEAVLEKLITGLGMDRDVFFEKIQSPAYKDKLRANTDELIARGGYGSPSLFVNDQDMYFGNDRLPLVERRLAELTAA
ncbi:MAG: 2-hydroxychromene-2-carboxylate isomerase [Pseudomonadales bacterium]